MINYLTVNSTRQCCMAGVDLEEFMSYDLAKAIMCLADAWDCRDEPDEERKFLTEARFYLADWYCLHGHDDCEVFYEDLGSETKIAPPGRHLEAVTRALWNNDYVTMLYWDAAAIYGKDVAACLELLNRRLQELGETAGGSEHDAQTPA